MKILVLRKMRYEGRFIYVMQFGNIFQYLFAEEGSIHQDNIVYKPHWFGVILFKLGFRNSPYSPHQIEEGERVVLSGAMATIDKLRDPKFKAEDLDEKQKAEAQAHAHEQGEKKCMWQTLQAKDDSFYWMCLTHGEAVLMKEGVAPKHEIHG